MKWVVVAVVLQFASAIVCGMFRVIDLVALTVGDLVVIAFLVLAARHRGGLAVLGFRSAPGRFIAAALLFGISLWLPAGMIVEWLKPPGKPEIIRTVIDASSLWATVGVVAVMPALAEEMIFRGVLARGLATRLPAPAAIVLSAIAFAAYHVLPAQMVGVFPLGLALGYLAIRSNSVVPGIVMHATNNVIGILLARHDLHAFERWVDTHPVPTLGLAAIAIAGGVALAR